MQEKEPKIPDFEKLNLDLELESISTKKSAGNSSNTGHYSEDDNEEYIDLNFNKRKITNEESEAISPSDDLNTRGNFPRKVFALTGIVVLAGILSTSVIKIASNFTAGSVEDKKPIPAGNSNSGTNRNNEGNLETANKSELARKSSEETSVNINAKDFKALRVTLLSKIDPTDPSYQKPDVEFEKSFATINTYLENITDQAAKISFQEDLADNLKTYFIRKQLGEEKLSGADAIRYQRELAWQLTSTVKAQAYK